MQFSKSDFSKRKAADVLIIPFWKGEKKAELACEEKGILSGLKGILEDFCAKSCKCSFYYPPSQKEKRFLLLGLGEKEAISLENIRKAYAAAVNFCKSYSIKKANVLFPKIVDLLYEDLVQAVSEGICLANYTFQELKSDPKKDPVFLLQSASLIGPSAKEMQRVNYVKKLVSGVYLTRDLVNKNADEITPSNLAKIATNMAQNHPKMKAEVFDKKRLEKEKMGLLLAVSRASEREPHLIFLSYNGDPDSKDRIALVGKGITYDTGGLSLKPTPSMIGMKADMGGAATVLGVIQSASALNLKVNILGVIPTAENAIGPNSYKLGDVYTAYSGKTVEIDNTDAEGRLALADALYYTVKNYQPSAIIDLATLTGAIVVALGEEISGLFSNSILLTEELQKASKKTGELLWPMPVHDEYLKLIHSDVADIKNAGSRYAGSITAALFLKEFVKDFPWVHLDIAGTAFLSKASGYNPKNGTGASVRLLIDFLEKMTPSFFKELKDVRG